MHNDPCVGIMDPKVVQAMCTTHNVSFDKHPIVLNLIVQLFGGGILFSQTDAVWRKRRTAIAPAFYKGKLVNLVELAKSCVHETHQRWKKLCANGKTRIDFMEEVSMMHVKILMSCAFGTDISDRLIDYETEGKVEKKNVAFVIRTVFHDCINRLADPHIVMFPFLATWHITPYERRLLRNCERLREFILSVVQSRRAAIKAGNDGGADLLGILLKDENFHNDDRAIVDECLTFFFAGSQTSSEAAQNLILMLIKHPEIKQKILNELDS